MEKFVTFPPVREALIEDLIIVYQGNGYEVHGWICFASNNKIVRLYDVRFMISLDGFYLYIVILRKNAYFLVLFQLAS